MSLAKVKRVQAARKDQGVCGNCGAKLSIGISYLHYTVGYRGMTRRRCTKVECYPKPSERESSLVASIYSAQEEADPHSASSYAELCEVRDAVAEACSEIAGEYEANEMYDRNSDLQERAEIVTSAGDELSNWEPDSEEPESVDWRDNYPQCNSFDSAHSQWLEEAQESLASAINEMEIP